MRKFILLITLLILTGCSNKQKLVVSFDTDGGTKVSTIGVYKNEKIAEPTEPIKEGYDFIYWTYKGRKFDFNSQINENIQLHAKWEKAKVNVTFDIDGTSSIQTISWGEKITKPSNPTKEGAAFLYWEKENEIYNFDAEVKKDITLTAKFVSYTESINYIANSSNTGYLITGYGYEEYLVIPSVYNDLPVIGFTSEFEGHKETRAIIMPDSIEKIIDFSNMISLEYVILSEKLTAIPDYAFSGCGNLKYINFPSELKIIGVGAFYQCYSMAEISLPEKLSEIQTMAFAACINLKKIEIPHLVQTISELAFAECHKLSTVVLSNGLQRLGYFTFQNCDSLKSIIIPEGVTNIEMGIFEGCENIKILCERQSQPDSWANDWGVIDYEKGTIADITWGYKE